MLDGTTFAHAHDLERLSHHYLTGYSSTCPPQSCCGSIAALDQVLDDNSEVLVTTPRPVNDLRETSGATDLLTLKALMVDVLLIDERLDVIDPTAIEGSDHR